MSNLSKSEEAVWKKLSEPCDFSRDAMADAALLAMLYDQLADEMAKENPDVFRVKMLTGIIDVYRSTL